MRTHWTEYAADGSCLGLFMVSAAGFASLLQHPASPVAAWLSSQALSPTLQRLPMGLAMGVTAIAIIYSPLGRRSGAHMNPAVTLTFAILRKVTWRDAAGYMVGQFVGAAVGLFAAVWLFRSAPGDPSVNYVATAPGPAGVWVAFFAELVIAFLMMTTVLTLSSTTRTAPYTGLAAGLLVSIFITVEAPFSGMSMNPARTLASNVPASLVSTLWIYFTAPVAGMLAAGGRFAWQKGRVPCAKLYHVDSVRCIFCGHDPAVASTQSCLVTPRYDE